MNTKMTYEVVENAETFERMLARVREAQKVFATYTQEQVDKIFRAAAMAANLQRIPLAKMAVEETGMGVVEDKVIKNHYAAEYIYNAYKNTKTCGVIEEDPAYGTKKIAEPIGVIGAVIPTTNPTSTAIFKTLIALKTRNGIIISPHPRAKKVGSRTVELMNEALDKLGMPKNLIQIIKEPTMELSAGLMKTVDLCICTGGPGLVKVAYSSGKPALGVGQGNVQVLVDRDVDYDEVAKMVIAGRTFDNGVLCTCEQNVICPKDKVDEMVAALRANGAYYIDNQADADKVRNSAFPDGVFNKEWTGTTIQQMADLAGLEGIPEDTKVLVCCTKGYARQEVLAKEKLFPMLALFTYDTWEECMEIARANLEMEGMGHSVVIHSNNTEHIEAVPTVVNVSRYAVNQVGGTALGGAMDNGLNPTTTLGCGTWGNNAISENLWFTHLMNVSRISYKVPDMYIPTDEEIWAD